MTTKCVLFKCPVRDCDWDTGTYEIHLEPDALSEYNEHFAMKHCPIPPPIREESDWD